MKNKSNKEKEKGEDSSQSLRIIYAFYCKLSKKSLKLKSFDDVTQKNEVMSLHELMTFCKNMQITAKQHKKADHNILSLFLDSKHGKVEKEEKEAMKNNAEPGKKQKQNAVEVVKEAIIEAAKQLGVDQLENNEFMRPHNHKQPCKLEEPKAVKTPQNYLNEKKIAEIFKRQASQQGEIDFETFIAVLKTIAAQMYTISSTSTTLTKPESTSLSINQDQSTSENTNFADLLAFINLDTKDHILQTFTKINQFHGTMDHLALFRSPVKKLNLKNDPLGKYVKTNETNKENTSNSRSLLGKTQNPPQKLPRVVKPKVHLKKELLTYAKGEAKTSKKDELQVFILANKSQIEHLNKSYLKNTINTINQPFNPKNPNLQQTLQLPSGYSSPKSDKKYSQRHKDKVLGDIHHKQISRLIDTSSLYDDAIFNKYLELNYKPNK